MGSGIAALMAKISWWWMVGILLGTILVFGNDQIIAWIRQMAGV
jgi:type IV secretion system protein VirB2